MAAKFDAKLKEAMAGGKAVLLSQEQYVDITGLPLHFVKLLCSPTCEKWRCARRFDERDVKRFSKNRVMIWYQSSNMVSGKDRPRLLDRRDPVRLDSSMLTGMDGTARGVVMGEIEKAADEDRLYLEDEKGSA